MIINFCVLESIVHMATSSEGLANSILTDLEVLEQIRIEEADFF